MICPSRYILSKEWTNSFSCVSTIRRCCSSSVLDFVRGRIIGSDHLQLIALNGFGNRILSQLFARQKFFADQATSVIGAPVSWARLIGPIESSWAGPRGPSGVITAERPAFNSPAICRRPDNAFLLLLPQMGRRPNRRDAPAKTRPSGCGDCRAEQPRGRTGDITNRCSCQKTMISGLPLLSRIFCSVRPLWVHLNVVTNRAMIAAKTKLSTKEPAKVRIRRFNIASQHSAVGHNKFDYRSLKWRTRRCQAVECVTFNRYSKDNKALCLYSQTGYMVNNRMKTALLNYVCLGDSHHAKS